MKKALEGQQKKLGGKHGLIKQKAKAKSNIRGKQATLDKVQIRWILSNMPVSCEWVDKLIWSV